MSSGESAAFPLRLGLGLDFRGEGLDRGSVAVSGVIWGMLLNEPRSAARTLRPVSLSFIEFAITECELGSIMIATAD
jgi:hypothetical protein